MTAIPVNPLAPIASQFVNGLDDSGNLLTSVVGFQDLDFTQIFGKSCTSTTENDISFGVKTFTLDADVDNIKLDYTVQFRSIDPDVWMYGIVTGYDDVTISPAAITVNIIKISPLVGTYDNWSIQVVAGPAFGLPASAALGYSSDSFAIPSVGGTVAITTDAGKFMPPGSHVLMYALEDSTQYFLGIVNTYNISTGAINVFVTNVGPSSTGTYANWAVQTIDGPAVNAQYISTSNTSLTIGTGTKTFTTQAGKAFAGSGGNSFAGFLATDANNTANWMLGFISGTYSGTTLALDVYATGGSGTIANWVIQQVIFPTGPSLSVGAVIDGMPLGPANVLYIRDVARNFSVGFGVKAGTLTDHHALQFNVKDGDRLLTLDSDIELDGNGHKLTLTGDATLPATSVSASTQAQMEAATDTTTFVSPGRQVFHPTQAKAFYSATITPTATGVNVSAVDSTNDFVTITAHGFITGDQIETVASWPAGVTNGQVYYVNALTVNTLALYITLANALADTSRVNITATTTGGTSRRFVYTNIDSYGMSAVSPIAGVPGTAVIQLQANISPSLSATHCWATLQPGVGLFAAGSIGFASPPTTITTSVLTFTVLLGAASGGTATGTLSWNGAGQQNTSPFTVQFIMYGDLA